MNVEQFRKFCLEKKGVEESFPFDEFTLVFKVGGKIFALTGLDSEEFTVNLKCDPDKSVSLRERYPEEIFPGYHMNKLHWNTVHFEKGLDNKLLFELIDDSYNLIVKSFTKKQNELYNHL